MFFENIKKEEPQIQITDHLLDARSWQISSRVRLSPAETLASCGEIERPESQALR